MSDFERTVREGLEAKVRQLEARLSAAEAENHARFHAIEDLEKEWRYAFAESQKQQERAIRAEEVVEAARKFANERLPFEQLEDAIRRYEEGQ